MIINDVNYGRIWAASGALGFFGEGYWFHQMYRLFVPGFTTKGLTFVSKTITTNPTKGNTPLAENWQPREWQPKAIWWDMAQGIALNAIGLSNFGAAAALSRGEWQKRSDPFMISWMPMGENPIADAERFALLLEFHRAYLSNTVALQINLSCPNTGENLEELIAGAVAVLKVLEQLSIPLIVKFNVLTTPQTVAEIANSVRVDGVVMSNTIPFGSRGLGINWCAEIGDSISPLSKRGLKQPGGLSGHLLFPIVRRWVEAARDPLRGLPINFCGGVDSADRVTEALSLPNVTSVSVGTALMLRPGGLASMIRAANA